MRQRSIQRPLTLYAIVSSLAVSLVVVMAGSIAMIAAVSSGRDALLRDTLHQLAPHLADGPSPARGSMGWGVTTATVGALGVDLATARELATQREVREGLSAVRVPGSPVERYLVFSVAEPVDLRGPLRGVLLTGLAAALLGGLLLGWLAARLVLVPLRSLEQLAMDEPSELFPASTAPDEISAVAASFRRTLRDRDARRVELERRNTELAQLGGQLSRAEKLASVGRLAAGVAHEIGNPLAAVMGYLRLLELDLDPAERKDVLSRSLRELDRIHDIIKKLLAYARADGPSSDEPRELSSSRLIDDTLVLLRAHPALSGVEIRVAPCTPDADRVRAPQRALAQVLTNLLINAGQALDGREERRIDIERAREGSRVALSISDTGPGVPHALREQIFDPFYTTKPEGEGTGLGLAVARSMAESMGGELRVDESSSGGARFTLRLPAVIDETCQPA